MTDPPESRPRVLVVSEQGLLAQSVRAALASRGFTAIGLRWPARPSDVARHQAPRAELGLLLSELDRWQQLQVARALVGGVPVRWIALAGSPPGATWGALLDEGAALVVPTSTTLDGLVGLLGEVREGRGQSTSFRELLVTEWRRVRAERERVAALIETLSPRERQVLTELYQGRSVATIADRAEVAEATVRTQVRAILRKLHVGSQLAAVAAMDFLINGDGLPGA